MIRKLTGRQLSISIFFIYMMINLVLTKEITDDQVPDRTCTLHISSVIVTSCLTPNEQFELSATPFEGNLISERIQDGHGQSQENSLNMAWKDENYQLYKIYDDQWLLYGPRQGLVSVVKYDNEKNEIKEQIILGSDFSDRIQNFEMSQQVMLYYKLGIAHIMKYDQEQQGQSMMQEVEFKNSEELVNLIGNPIKLHYDVRLKTYFLYQLQKDQIHVKSFNLNHQYGDQIKSNIQTGKTINLPNRVQKYINVDDSASPNQLKIDQVSQFLLILKCEAKSSKFVNFILSRNSVKDLTDLVKKAEKQESTQLSVHKNKAISECDTQISIIEFQKDYKALMKEQHGPQEAHIHHWSEKYLHIGSSFAFTFDSETNHFDCWELLTNQKLLKDDPANIELKEPYMQESDQQQFELAVKCDSDFIKEVREVIEKVTENGSEQTNSLAISVGSKNDRVGLDEPQWLVLYDRLSMDIKGQWAFCSFVQSFKMDNVYGSRCADNDQDTLNFEAPVRVDSDKNSERSTQSKQAQCKQMFEVCPDQLVEFNNKNSSQSNHEKDSVFCQRLHFICQNSNQIDHDIHTWFILTATLTISSIFLICFIAVIVRYYLIGQRIRFREEQANQAELMQQKLKEKEDHEQSIMRDIKALLINNCVVNDLDTKRVNRQEVMTDKAQSQNESQIRNLEMFQAENCCAICIDTFSQQDQAEQIDSHPKDLEQEVNNSKDPQVLPDQNKLDDENPMLRIRLPQCGHNYHFSCIVDWLNQQKEKQIHFNCPVCREEFKLQLEPKASLIVNQDQQNQSAVNLSNPIVCRSCLSNHQSEQDLPHLDLETFVERDLFGNTLTSMLKKDDHSINRSNQVNEQVCEEIEETGRPSNKLVLYSKSNINIEIPNITSRNSVQLFNSLDPSCNHPNTTKNQTALRHKVLPMDQMNQYNQN